MFTLETSLWALSASRDLRDGSTRNRAALPALALCFIWLKVIDPSRHTSPEGGTLEIFISLTQIIWERIWQQQQGSYLCLTCPLKLLKHQLIRRLCGRLQCWRARRVWLDCSNCNLLLFSGSSDAPSRLLYGGMYGGEKISKMRECVHSTFKVGPVLKKFYRSAWGCSDDKWSLLTGSKCFLCYASLYIRRTHS